MAVSRALLFLGGVTSGGVGVYVYDHTRTVRKKIHVEYQEISPEERKKQERSKEILKYGKPDRGSDMRLYTNHVLCYDRANKIPVWVAEHLTQTSLQGDANRKNSKFKADPGIPSQYSAENSDYWKSGWSRGHMAPAGDNKSSQEAMNETFYLSNILPQDINNNGNFWNKFEIYCRDLTKSFKNVRVISGPIMMPNIEEGGKKFVKYQVIGKNDVAVPTHLYKVLQVDNGDMYDTTAVAAFVVPNLPIPNDHTLKQYQVPLESLEQRTGITFLPKLDHKNTKDLCDIDDCKMISYEELELYFIGRKMANATTLHRLETVWKEMQEKKIAPDTYALDLYKKKKAELTKQEKDTTDRKQ